MKTTIVPAQITTVEDKVAGNLSFTQLLLMIIPVFLGGAIFAFLPPLIEFTIYKTVIVILLALLCSALAIRIKGKLVMEWILIRGKYNLRPRRYVFNKNDSYLRPVGDDQQDLKAELDVAKHEVAVPAPLRIGFGQRVALETVMIDPRANLHFKTDRKGGLRVHITEIK